MNSNLKRLTTKEIEQRIEDFQQRTLTLNEIIKDVSDDKARATLCTHLNSYKETLDGLRLELQNRNR